METKEYTYKREYTSRKTGEVRYLNIRVNYKPRERKPTHFSKEELEEIKKLLELDLAISKIAKKFNSTAYKIKKAKAYLKELNNN